MSNLLKITVSALLIVLAASTAMGGSPSVADDCPCKESINKLISTYDTDARFRELLDAAFANMQQTPPDYPVRNPWIGKSFPDLVSFMEQWCAFLPQMHGSKDDGLKYIQDMALFYYDNPFGVAFVQLSPGERDHRTIRPRARGLHGQP